MTIVTAKVNYNCGCSWKGRNVEEALEHVNKTGHKVGVLGLLVPEREPPRELADEME